MNDIPMAQLEKGMDAILDRLTGPSVPLDADAPGEVKALLARIQTYRHRCVGYDDRKDQYLYHAPFCPEAQMPVGAALEPVVPAPEYRLDDNAAVTLNHYDALVLNSKNMLILDVDFDDRRYNKWAVANSKRRANHVEWSAGSVFRPFVAGGRDSSNTTPSRSAAHPFPGRGTR
jgi:hypothetical protein